MMLRAEFPVQRNRTLYGAFMSVYPQQDEPQQSPPGLVARMNALMNWPPSMRVLARRFDGNLVEPCA